MSSIGKPDRQQWFGYNKVRGEKIDPHMLILFLYGHMTEELILLLTRLSGHSVTDEQKLCEVAGVKGSMDCTIDGITVDVKSTSARNFKKFQDGSLATEDPYGYIDQVKAYAHSQGERKWAWLAMDKSSGKLCVLKQDLDDTDDPMHEWFSEDIEKRIEHVKTTVKQEERPDICYPLEKAGKSGNTKLGFNCGFCQFKKHCYPDLRAFNYAWGTEYLVDVMKAPRVTEEEGF